MKVRWLNLKQRADSLWRKLPGAHTAGHKRCLCLTFQRCLMGPAANFRDVKKGLLTYGSKGGEQWSRIPIYQEVMVPLVVRNGPNKHPSIDTNPLIYRPVDLSRLIWTFTVDPPTGTWKYGRYRPRLSIHIRSISTSTINPPTGKYGQSLIVD